MTLEALTAKLLSDPKVKKYYDELKPEFDKAKKRILKNRRKELVSSCSSIVEDIAKEFPGSLEELHQILVEFKESQKNK